MNGDPLGMDGYPYVIPIDVRWRDLDPLGHVNNAVIVSYLEVARASLWRERFEVRQPQEIPFVVARVTVDYRKPVLLADRVEVGLRVSRIGRASFSFAYRIDASGELAAHAETVQVMLDAERKRPTLLPRELRQALQGLQALQGPGSEE